MFRRIREALACVWYGQAVQGPSRAQNPSSIALEEARQIALRAWDEAERLRTDLRAKLEDATERGDSRDIGRTLMELREATRQALAVRP